MQIPSCWDPQGGDLCSSACPGHSHFLSPTIAEAVIPRGFLIAPRALTGHPPLPQASPGCCDELPPSWHSLNRTLEGALHA